MCALRLSTVSGCSLLKTGGNTSDGASFGSSFFFSSFLFSSFLGSPAAGSWPAQSKAKPSDKKAVTRRRNRGECIGETSRCAGTADGGAENRPGTAPRVGGCLHPL